MGVNTSTISSTILQDQNKQRQKSVSHSQEKFWKYKNNTSYRDRLQRNQLNAAEFMENDKSYWQYSEKLSLKPSSNSEEINQENIDQQKQKQLQVNKQIEADLLKMQRKKTQKEDRGKPMIDVSHIRPYTQLKQLNLPENYDGSQSSSLGPALNCVVQKAKLADTYAETLKHLQQIMNQFAIEQQITSQAFKNIIGHYQAMNDEILNKKFLPLIIKIHSKIYDRLRRQISQVIQHEISTKIKQYQLHIQSQVQNGDMCSKIEALAEQLAYKQKKISQLEQDMQIQVSFVKSCHNKVSDMKKKNQQYQGRLGQLKDDKQRLKQKINKYSTILEPYKHKRKNSSEYILPPQSQIENH